MGMRISKLPLIFIVASGKLLVNWQIRVVKSKYGVPGDNIYRS